VSPPGDEEAPANRAAGQNGLYHHQGLRAFLRAALPLSRKTLD
jgi:hypothetical protein